MGKTSVDTERIFSRISRKIVLSALADAPERFPTSEFMPNIGANIPKFSKHEVQFRQSANLTASMAECRNCPRYSFDPFASFALQLNMWRSILKNLAKPLAAITALYVSFCLALFFLQRNLIYFPQVKQNPMGLPTITLKTDAGNVTAITKEFSGDRALIYFGGNAEDVSQSLPLLSQAFPDCAIYLLNYRGYGGSAGEPSEASIISDADRLFGIVHARHRKVLLIGRSLGSGVAVQIASKHAVEGLILVTPYDSVQALAAMHFKYVPVQMLLRDKFESWKYVPQIASPTLLIAAEHDEVIPREHTSNLFSHFTKGVAVLKTVPGTGHNDIANSPEYVKLLRGAW